MTYSSLHRCRAQCFICPSLSACLTLSEALHSPFLFCHRVEQSKGIATRRHGTYGIYTQICLLSSSNPNLGNEWWDEIEFCCGAISGNHIMSKSIPSVLTCSTIIVQRGINIKWKKTTRKVTARVDGWTKYYCGASAVDSEWSNQQSGATTPLNRDIEIRETENIRVTMRGLWMAGVGGWWYLWLEPVE